MTKSTPLAKILSRLHLRGTVLTSDSPGVGQTSKFEGFVPLIGSNGKLSPSVIGVGSIEVGAVQAEQVTFLDNLEGDPTAANVRIALNNITKDNGLALLRAKNLADVADSVAAFNILKKNSTVASSGSVTAGVVGIASQTEVEAGTDSATETSLTTSLLAVSPSTAKATYLSKIATSAQTINSQIVLPGNPTANLQAATKQYVDAQVAAAQSFPTANTIWVDAVNGSDATGERGKMAKPVLTLTYAKSLALAGDLIYVRPGTYNENDLAKHNVTWWFEAGAKVYYTSGGDSTVALFNVATNEICNVFGEGEFYNLHGSSNSRYVLYVRNGSKCVFKGKLIQSARSAIYVDASSTGYATIILSDSLRSDDLAGSGSCAARLVSGEVSLIVGREIYSNASQFQAGLEFGTGSGSAGVGTQIVQCPKIHGKHNAIHFANTVRSHVVTQICTATDGPAVKVDGGAANVIEGTSDLHTDTGSYPAVIMTKGRLSLVNVVLYNANGQAGVYMNGTPYDPTAPYLVLKNSEIWSAGSISTAISANSSGYFTVRIVGSAQSDCVEPTAVIRVGGAWDYVPAGDA